MFLLLVILGCLTGLLVWLRSVKNYWKNHGVVEIPSIPILGNFWETFAFKKSAAALFDDLYYEKNTKDEPVVGVHCFHKPSLFVKDPELIKQVLVKDFNNFSDRHVSSDPHSDALGSNNLFMMRNPEWREMRSKLSPVFTSGKMRHFFNLMMDVAADLEKSLASQTLASSTNSFETEMKDFCALFTTDVIATCAYGVEAHSLVDPNSEFRRNGRKVFDFNFRRSLELNSFFYLPETVPLFRYKLFSKETTEFLRSTMRYVMSEREKTGTTRNDLIDILISLKNAKKDKEDRITFDGDVLVAQAGVFFTAGFETSSATMSFALYELAKQPHLQTRLQHEIRQHAVKHGGKLTYDNINELEYLAQVIQETLRMYPPLPFLDRIFTPTAEKPTYPIKPYADFSLPPGMPIFIPIYSIQRDPKYFPDPNTFNPDRFSAENKDNLTPYTYLAFGTGPHNCIGERFGVMQAKIGLITILKSYTVEFTKQTPREMVLEKKALILQAKDGIQLNVKRV